MLKNYIKKLCGILLCVCFVFAIHSINFELIFSLTGNDIITIGNLEKLNLDKNFGSVVSGQINESVVTTGNSSVKSTKLTIKLFGFIPIKTVDVVVTPDKTVYLGGVPLGFSITTKGVIVVGQNSVVSESGNVFVETSQPIKNGDILEKVNGIDISNIDYIKQSLAESAGNEITLSLIRDGKSYNVKTKPVKDVETGEYKLGLWVRDDAQGIGTLTFVTEQNKFGALGHPICDYETGACVTVGDGDVYNCSTLGVTKGEKGKAGELRCLFIQGKNSKGEIAKNTNCGVFGTISDRSQIIDENVVAQLGTRMVVRTGDAKIISSVSGIREEYDIEIIKTYRQPKSGDKSFVFRVKDPRLISLTGGIVQGMSGSPIVQDGKLIGAVTHVFLYDPTKGYGVYADWMFEELDF
ncbi:MAG: SpoIVB peptidase [Clostridia bacterium]|nr:SpoIVB peptidase [Clostridia bacterium]